jgi:signal transduction histidine kinase
MIKLRTKLALFNFISKLVFTGLFIIFLPFIIDRINTLQTDDELIQKREEVIALISKVGIEPFINQDTVNGFGSYNILKEEFISLEMADLKSDWNFIEVSKRLIDDETIDYRVLNYSFKVDGITYLLQIGKSLSSILHTRKNIKIVILIFLVSIILITLLLDLIYSRKVLHPLEFIISKLKSTSTPSLFDKTPVRTSTSDFWQLDFTIRELMNRIDNLFQQEKEITVNISHELMTPISVLRSKLENILLQQNLDEDTSARIEESLRTLHRLKTLVNSLLFIARIENRQYIREDSFSIKDLLNEVIDEIEPIIVDAGISLKNEISADLMYNNANRSLIFSMIYNVLNNAVKNTPSMGKITITNVRHKDRFEVTISDTGMGIPKEKMDSLFLRFKKKQDTNRESTGIGLAITKSIADFHNIEISITSAPEKGTSFSFLFPVNS